MASSTAKQVAVKIQNDIKMMTQWASDAQDKANREGHLDRKFLEARFEKGKQSVAEYMNAHISFAELDDMRAGHHLKHFASSRSAAAGRKGNLIDLAALCCWEWPCLGSQKLQDARVFFLCVCC